jgi:hypothetical protein
MNYDEMTEKEFNEHLADMVLSKHLNVTKAFSLAEVALGKYNQHPKSIKYGLVCMDDIKKLEKIRSTINECVPAITDFIVPITNTMIPKVKL